VSNDEVWYTGNDVKGNISLIFYRAKLFQLHIKIQFLLPSIYSSSQLQRSIGLLSPFKWPLLFFFFFEIQMNPTDKFCGFNALPLKKVVHEGRAIAQAVSRRLPTAVARVQTRV
jgi:hypothetical protein